LNGLLQRLDESFEQLKRFTSDVSHELRTPLASIRSVGEVGLHREHSAHEYRDIIGSMLEELNTLSQTVETLLTISRAEAGHLTLHQSRFCMLELLREVVRLVSVLAEEKEQTIVVSGEESIWVRADRQVLRQAIMNLLDNAAKYSPTGGTIQVNLKLMPAQDDRPRSLKLTIEDEGPGISDEFRNKVFDRFYRVDAARSREAGGAGLGLAIAKWGVEVHGGEIGHEPRKPSGSAFYILLPLEDSI